MAIQSVLATKLSIGAINTTASASTTHNFGPSSIFSYPVLQVLTTYDDESNTEAFISRFVDAQGTHNVQFIGVFAQACTSVTFRMKVDESFGKALCITEFFG